MPNEDVVARIQLRDKLQGLRNRVGEEAVNKGASLMEAHKRVDSKLSRRVSDANSASRNRKRILLGCAVLLLVSWCTVFYVLPSYSPAVDSFVTRLGGRMTYPVQRLTRFISLPFMWRFPRLAEYMYNPTCSVNNPWYVSESEEGTEEYVSAVPRKKGAGKASKMLYDYADADPDASLDESEVPKEACSCIGINSAGRVKNRVTLKLKHIKKDPGIPLVLKADNSSDLAPTKALREALLKAFAEHPDEFKRNICHAQLSGSDESKQCADKVNQVLTALLQDGTEVPDSFFATW